MIRRADVAVVGGGSAGIAAAVAAARMGAQVVLIERSGALGGQVTGAFVHTICGLYLLREDSSQPLEFANPGFPTEFAQKLVAMGGSPGPVRMGRLDVLPHEPSAFGILAGRLCDELPGLCVERHAHLESACSSGQRLALQVRHLEGCSDWNVGAVVDATGDGQAAALLGGGWAQADALQRPASIVKLAGVDPGALDGDRRMAIAQSLAAAVADGHLAPAALGTAFRPALAPGEIWATTDLAAPDYDPHDPAQLDALASEARTLAREMVLFLQQNIPGFERAFLAATPERVGVRESRRITGDYELTADDILEGARFPDSVANSAWPMELRETATGPKFRFPTANRSCQIPLRALRSANVPRLFMAGRCISCSHEAQAAIRIIGTCLATGEAAGQAAATEI